jgi:hypothetical protein
MIIEKTFKKGDVVSIKLVTGEEIIGQFSEAVDGDIKLLKPTHFVPHNDQIHFPAYLMSSAETRFTFPKEKIMVIAETQTDIAKLYTKQTTSIQMV